ncbi:MAG: tetratricopeptide repeat protein [Nitrospinota bacterium]|nr:tetratricopeptide repeat protein [Nitrospinota bacterium]
MKRKKITFILTGLGLLFLADSSIALVTDSEKAIDAYNKGNYKTSAKLILPLAKKGLAKAQYNLGVMYEKGIGVEKNLNQAKKWFQFAAEQGLAKAQYNLGLMYGKGKGVEKDYSQAIKWMTLAADQGNGKAQTNLGWMYETGKGVPRDTQKALSWYHLASDQGLAKAQEKLNLLLKKNKENLQERSNDLKEFVSLKEKHPELNEIQSEKSNEIAKTNETDLKTGQEQPNLISTKKAEAQIHFGLGVRFENGEGVPQDYNEAIRWYRLAADEGHGKAQEKLNTLLNKIKEHLQDKTP